MAWDVIVIGAGSAGCALTFELVNAGLSVLLLEAGGSDRSPWVKIPAGAWRLAANGGGPYDWGYQALPDASRNGVTEPWYRGRMLGGTSSINGMIYVRGAASDFDRWAQHCSHQGGWSAREVMPIFRQFECSDQLTPFRGRSGTLYTRTVRRPHAVTQAFVESACAAGYPFNPDYNGPIQEGVSYLQSTHRHGLRCSAADAFLRPIWRQKNLHIKLGATVEKIEIEHGMASAVLFRLKNALYREEARDVVVSAGAINTPKILMLSGIGDPEELRRFNIEEVIDLPGVGSNLREHPLLTVGYRSKVPTYNLTEGVLQKLGIGANYLAFQEGPLAAAYQAAAFLKTQSSAPGPQMQIFFAPIGWEKVGMALELCPYPALKVCVVHSHSMNSGRIRLASADPSVPPLIDCRLLESESDVDMLVRGIETVRSIMNTRPISNLVEAETEPGAPINSKAALREFVRGNAQTSCHPIGTCRMGLGDDAVVGPDLRVHGTENLWVADASIMPDPISANLNAPCMMIGAKLGQQLAARRHP